jgi:DNA-binding beta-propeller fold protein YncE
MQSVHCLAGTRDGHIYVCNRQQGRIQIYDKTGRLVRNIDAGGSAVALDFSPDASQRWIFVINQNYSRIEIIDRERGAIVGNVGRAGQLAGEFDQPHGIAVDSRGNVYVAENRGKRVQKFVPVVGR